MVWQEPIELVRQVVQQVELVCAEQGKSNRHIMPMRAVWDSGMSKRVEPEGECTHTAQEFRHAVVLLIFCTLSLN